MSIFKVTVATTGETKRGYKVFKLQVNNSIWATKLFPLRELDRKYDKLYQMYLEHDNISFLEGKYISVSLNQSEYGYQFSSIGSFDAVQEFKDLLDNSEGKAFSTSMDMHEFLKTKNHPINKDGSITLKAPYDGFNLTENNVCYPNDLRENTLTPDNIGIIFNQFYRDKVIDNGNPDRDERYVLTATAIVINRKIYHKYKSKTLSNDNFDVLRIGDSLSKEQYEFISKR